MAQLQSTNVVGTLCVNGVAVGGGKDFKFCCFTGSDNWTPSSDLATDSGTVETVIVSGGGGGGAAASCSSGTYRACATLGMGGGGGGGEVLHKFKTITSTDACCHVIGAGGTAAADYTTPGNAGGDSTFLGFTAFGGGGGQSICCRHTGGSSISATSLNGNPGGPASSYTAQSQTNCFPFYFQNGYMGGASTVGIEMNLNSSKSECLFSMPGTSLVGPIQTGKIPGNPSYSGSITSGMKYGGWGPESFGEGGASNKNKVGVVNPLAYGLGGNGSTSCTACCQGLCSCVGDDGRDGIVVLKWAE
jgi:hypothetical protein